MVRSPPRSARENLQVTWPDHDVAMPGNIDCNEITKGIAGVTLDAADLHDGSGLPTDPGYARGDNSGQGTGNALIDVRHRAGSSGQAPAKEG